MIAPRNGGVLFVSHDATRTGAPTNLLHFLRWYKRNGGRPFSVMLGAGGELVGEFEEVADTWSQDWSRWCPGGSRARLLSRAGLGRWSHRAQAREIRRFVGRASPALVYANSVCSAAIVDTLPLKAPILTHVHELELVLGLQSSGLLSRLLEQTSRFIACSRAVRDNLVENHGVAAERVDVVHESIPVQGTQARQSVEEARRSLGLASDALVVAGGGHLRWLKGPDLFVQLARSVSQLHANVFFVWIGGGSREDLANFDHDVRRAGLEGTVRRVGPVNNVADYLAVADVFVLPSREDSFPLICLEAAACGKPIVCFADAGGMPEFVEDDCGFVVPYLDLAAMAARLVRLIESPDCRLRMGAAARQKVTGRHDLSVAGPRIADIIERVIEAC